jgi:hypothetical protein
MCLLWLTPLTSAASPGLSVGISSGVSNLEVYAGEDGLFAAETGLGPEFRVQVNLEWDTLDSAFGFFYQGRYRSKIGSFPSNRFGLAGNYYPMGLPISTRILGSGVRVTQNKFSPFISVQTFFNSIGITAPIDETDDILSFNGLAMGYQLGAGAEIPISTGLSFSIHGLYEGTLLGGDGSYGDTSLNSPLHVKGVIVLIGLTIHP